MEVGDAGRHQAYKSFDAAAQLLLGISAEEFVARFNAGEYKDVDVDPGVVEVLMLAPRSVNLREARFCPSGRRVLCKKRSFERYAIPTCTFRAPPLSFPITACRLALSQPGSAIVMNGSQLLLYFQHTFSVPKSEDGLFDVTSEGYAYAVLERQAKGKAEELFAYHWHPLSTPNRKTAHLHIGAGGHSPRKHLPTGRVSIESVVELVISDYGVQPCVLDWQLTLTTNRLRFEAQRRWA